MVRETLNLIIPFYIIMPVRYLMNYFMSKARLIKTHFISIYLGIANLEFLIFKHILISIRRMYAATNKFYLRLIFYLCEYFMIVPNR